MFRLIDILIWPLAACLSMGLLHGYAGLHVLRRGVIFVDLALAQMAALGAVVGMVMALHHEPHPAVPPPQAAVSSAPADELDQAIQQAQGSNPVAAQESHEDESHGFLDFWPTVFALGGAVLLAFGKAPGERVPHEAIIGIVYVVAAAVTVLILSKAAHGHDEMEQMLSGKLLYVDRSEVLNTGVLYAFLGLLHWIFRRQFLAVSASPELAAQSGLWVRFWDCLFYAMFAIMVTRSVAVGGVLIVFSFLIIPGACAAMLADSFRMRVVLAWITATVVSVVGVIISAVYDLPTGPTLVTTFGATLVIFVLMSPLARRRNARDAGTAPMKR